MALLNLAVYCVVAYEGLDGELLTGAPLSVKGGSVRVLAFNHLESLTDKTPPVGGFNVGVHRVGF